MKRLIPIVLLLMLPMSSWATSGSTMVHITDSAANSTTAGPGISRQGRPVAVSSDGDVAVMWRPSLATGGIGLDWFTAFSTTKDTQFAASNGIFGATRGEVQSMLYAFYDSIYAVNAATTEAIPFKIVKYVNGVGVRDSSASSETTTGADKPGIVHSGTSLLVAHITEDSTGATADTMRAYTSSGAWGAHTWTQVATRRPPISTGPRLPMNLSGGGVAILFSDANAEDAYIATSSAISGIIEAAMVATDRNVPGFYRYDAIPFGSVDTFLQVWQEDTTAANGAIKARPAHLNGTSSVVFDTAAEITVVAAGSFGSKYAACPTVTWFPGTDSGMIIWRDLVVTGDTTVIMGKLISRYGKTYGADTLLYQMPNTTRKGWGLMASNTWINGNTKNFVIVMQDSLAASTDSARALFVTYDTGDPTPVVVDHSSNTFKNSIAGPQPINRITGPAYVNKK